MKIILENISNVGDLVEALSTIPKETKIHPFGEIGSVLAYDEKEKRAYIDSMSFIESINN